MYGGKLVQRVGDQRLERLQRGARRDPLPRSAVARQPLEALVQRAGGPHTASSMLKATSRPMMMYTHCSLVIARTMPQCSPSRVAEPS